MRTQSLESFGSAALYAAALCVLSACPVAAQAAPDAYLEVTHRSSSLGADGIQRSTAFTEKVLRRGDMVWIERVLPNGAHAEAEHAQAKNGTAKDHKHADLSAATRWIQRGADGKLTFRLVAAHDKVIVDIAPAEYGTVGFDGSWPAAYHLIDPVVLKKLKPGAKSGSGQWFESTGKLAISNPVRVLWDSGLEIPLQVHTTSANGNSTRSTTVRVLKAGATAPWSLISAYVVKDYSDFLD
jgi:hypothetical protein